MAVISSKSDARTSVRIHSFIQATGGKGARFFIFFKKKQPSQIIFLKFLPDLPPISFPCKFVPVIFALIF